MSDYCIFIVSLFVPLIYIELCSINKNIGKIRSGSNHIQDGMGSGRNAEINKNHALKVYIDKGDADD